MPPPLRVLLVDDSSEFLTSLSNFLSRFNRLGVVGVARNGAECIDRALELSPDLLLVDLAMPGLSGLEATRALRARGFPGRIVIVTLLNGEPYRESARHAGADAFVNKSEITTSLLPTIESLFPPANEAGPAE